MMASAQRAQRVGTSALTYAGLAIGGLVAGFPFVWMVLASFMTRGETLRRVFVPEALQWGNYVRAWSEEIWFEALMLWNKLGFTFSQADFQRGDEKRHGFYVARRL